MYKAIKGSLDMAWCENENCRKDGLRKADVEFCEVTHKVLCHGCYALVHPGWIPPPEYVDMTDCGSRVYITPPDPKIGFAIQITDGEGVKAKISYGGASIAFHAPTMEIKKIFGV